MGVLDWFRRRASDEPDIIPLPALRPPAATFWSAAIIVDETGLNAVAANGQELRVEFSDLDRVAIRTTDEGPGAEDVYWLLVAGSQECLIPHGASGEPDLFDRLLRLPLFDSQAMVAAMTGSDHAEFECWQRPLNQQ